MTKPDFQTVIKSENQIMKPTALVTVLIAATCLVSAYAEDTAAAKPKKSLRQKIAERQARDGGLVEAPVTGAVITVYNCQNVVEKEDVKAIVDRLREVARLPFVLREGVDGMSDLSIRPVRGGTLTLGDQPQTPVLTVCPEEAFANVNVGRLAEDDPSYDRLKARLEKEMWRALCMAMGASNALFQPCLLRTIRSLRDLDNCANEIPSPEPLGKLETAAKQYGVLRLRKVTYKTACFEGWALAPTNDLQRTIFNGVKDGTIQPPAKKQ